MIYSKELEGMCKVAKGVASAGARRQPCQATACPSADSAV